MPNQNQNQQNSQGDGTSQGAQGQDQQDQQQQQQQQQQQAPTFETWLAAQPKDVQTLIDGHVQGLRNTVTATRGERDDALEQVKKIAKTAEKGSELETQLRELSSKLETANKKADFLEAAPAHECRNSKAAFALMTSLNLTTRSGEPDWEALKREAPELFGKVQANANAGGGTGQGNQGSNPHQAMNDFIRGGKG